MPGRVRMMMLAGLTTCLAACDADRLSTDDPVWTLYRRDAAAARRHVATFDSERRPGAGGSNGQDCEAVSRSLNDTAQDGRFWCELGRYRARPRTGSP